MGKRLISVRAECLCFRTWTGFRACIESKIIRFPFKHKSIIRSSRLLERRKRKEKIKRKGKEWRNTYVENETYIYIYTCSGVIKAYRSLTERNVEEGLRLPAKD